MTELKYNSSFPNTIKEMLKHEEKCNNETCKVKGWDKLKVIEVEYIGFAVDDEKKNEESVDSYESYDLSANDQNGDNDDSPLGPDSSIENSEYPTSSPRPDDSYEPYDPSPNDQNGDNDNSPLGPDSSVENSETPTSSPRPESCSEHSDNNSSRHARSLCCVS